MHPNTTYGSQLGKWSDAEPPSTSFNMNRSNLNTDLNQSRNTGNIEIVGDKHAEHLRVSFKNAAMLSIDFKSDFGIHQTEERRSVTLDPKPLPVPVLK